MIFSNTSFKNKSPEERLMISVLLHAMRDYDSERGQRESVREWADEMKGTFDMCATAVGCTPDVLREMVIKKLDAMDNGERLFEFRQ